MQTVIKRRYHEAMSTFTKEQMKHIGDLASIALSDEEIDRFLHELDSIAESISQMQDIPTDNVEPTTNPIAIEAYLRPDEAVTPLSQKDAIAGAPVSEAGMFVAPKILGEE